ncbi:MAG: S9 family peptidase [Pseudomonadota bacterium]
MKKLLLPALLALMTPLTTGAAQILRMTEGNRTYEAVPAIPDAALNRAEQYANVRSAYALDWHPTGGSILVSTRFGDTSQLHLVSEPLGLRRQLTFFGEPVTNGQFAPSTEMNTLVFGRDTGGNENYQLFRFDLDDGRISPLTPPGARSGSALWSHDGKQIAYQSNRDDRTRFDVWLVQVENPGAARMLVKGTGFYWSPVAWSRDNQKLLVRQTVSAVDARLFVIDVATGASRQLGPTDKKLHFGGAVFSDSGDAVYTTSNEDSEFSRLVRLDLATGEQQVITPDIPWDVQALSLSADGRQLAFTTNEGGISRLYLLSTGNDKYKRVTRLPQGIISGIGFAPKGRDLALTLNRATSPADVYVLDTRRDRLTRWTESEVGGLNPDRFVEAELIRFPTFDRIDGQPRMIPAFVYRPTKTAAGKRPVIVSIHGGPEGQTRPGFSSRTQQMVSELDAVVIAPNVRGSSGYGKTYLDLDNVTRREESVRDIGALLDWIGTQPDLDAGRVALIGGSYGGYMVLASMTLYNDRIKAGVNYFGVSNFVTFLQNTSDYRRDHRRQEYGDERDPVVADYLNRTAPMNNVQKISRPLFVLQGANDPRVPASESEQIVAKVRANGGDVWYLLFDDEGHGFRKKPNVIFSDAAVMTFFRTYL